MSFMNHGETTMDDKMMRRINRQLRAIKVMLGFFSLLMLGMLATLAFLAYSVVTFVNRAEDKITDIQNTTEQKLDIKAQLCDDPNQNALTNQFCN
jgi:hypothetical protein